MFCQKCGHEITEADRFCPNCGQPQYFEDVNVQDQGYCPPPDYEEKGAGGSFNIKDLLTVDNIERFAPTASILPLGLSVLICIVFSIIYLILGGIPFVRFFIGAIVFILKLLFCLITLASALGLAYVAVDKRDTSRIYTWIPAVACLSAFISCLSISFSWSVTAWIFGIIAFVLGFELIARITVNNNPIDTPMQPAQAFSTYGDLYRIYREKYPSTKNETAVIDSSADEASYFDGRGVELFGYILLGAILCTVTCGIAAPWVICMVYNWKIRHTVINGKRLTFEGNGASLLGHWILWEILTIITCGIYSYFTYVEVRKWELSHTYIDGEPIIPGQDNSKFDGNSFEFFGYGVLGTIMTSITCGIAYPWVMCMIQKWDTKHQIINGRRLAFNGTGLAFLGEYIIIFLLTCITCTIYLPWGIVRMNKYIIRHTNFDI